MIRRSFRIGLWLGLLAGIAVAVVKVVQARQPAPSPAPARTGPRPEPWPRLETPSAPVNPTPAVTPPVAAAPSPPPVAAAPPVAAKKPPAAKKTAAKKAPAKAQPTWVDPTGNICPKTHPVKAKLSSKIFQLPGMFAYDRTKPDRCYKNAAGAEGDGFRAAKR